MTQTPLDPDELQFDPGSMPGSSLSAQRAVWYRRPWFLAAIGVILVVGVSVITDLPHPITKAEDASDQNGIIKQINGNTNTCVFALKEGFGFYRDALAHTLQAANLATVRNYLLEDQTACSFASGPVFNMTSVQPTDTTAGKEIANALAATVKWITYDAVGALVEVRNYFGSTPPHVNTAKLVKWENALAVDRASIVANVNKASALLGTTLTPINIPVIPRLPGT